MAKKIKDENGKTYVQKKPFYKRVWFWILAIIVIIIVASSMGGKKSNSNNSNSSSSNTSAKKHNAKSDGMNKADYDAVKLSETDGTAKSDLIAKLGKANSTSDNTVGGIKAEDLTWDKVDGGEMGSSVIIGFSNEHAVSKAISGLKVSRSKKIDLDTFNSIENGMSEADLTKKIGKPNGYSETSISGQTSKILEYTSDIKGDIGANFNVTIENGAVSGKTQTSMK
ncbi:DUF3862 domain-containing protein [Companilactobacillus sp. DQM5]|uniref:DUF3862 domain-containing protein n=1 Tax=Companilactobacillus sp. DQM5 TaxID=3463359 RepID=UPI00405873BE